MPRGEKGGGEVRIEAGVERKERTCTRLAPGRAAQTTHPRRAASINAAALRNKNVQPRGRRKHRGKAGAVATPTPGDTPRKGDAAPCASAPCLTRREVPRTTPSVRTPSPLNPSDSSSRPRQPENRPARPKSTQEGPGAPRDGQLRRTAEHTGRWRRPATPENAWHCPEACQRRRPATPDTAWQRQGTTPSNAQQCPGTHQRGPQDKRGSEAAPGGPISDSPAMRTQQRPLTSGNPPLSGGKPPPTATPTGFRHSR